MSQLGSARWSCRMRTVRQPPFAIFTARSAIGMLCPFLVRNRRGMSRYEGGQGRERRRTWTRWLMRRSQGSGPEVSSAIELFPLVRTSAAKVFDLPTPGRPACSLFCHLPARAAELS